MLCDQSLWVRWRGLTFDRTTSPLGLLLLQDLLALLSSPLVDRVARVIDLEGVLVMHVGVLDFSGLLVKLQNVAHPKSDKDRGRSEFKGWRREQLLNHSSVSLDGRQQGSRTKSKRDQTSTRMTKFFSYFSPVTNEPVYLWNVSNWDLWSVP